MPAEFNLLGEVEVIVDAGAVDLGHARQRSVLAVLLVNANRLVPTGQLVDRVWGEQAPPRARNALYGYIHHLRAALAGAADIQRKDGGYLLEVDPATIDLHRFRTMVERARADEDERRGRTLLGEALGLWRGEAFAGASTPWLATVRDSLEHDRLEARLEHHELALRHDHHTAVLPDLRALAEEHPLDERIAGQLMRALHRAGRSAAALDHYHQLRRRLADELGVDPGARVQEVFRLLLAGEPNPAPPATESHLPETQAAQAQPAEPAEPQPAKPQPAEPPPAEPAPSRSPDAGIADNVSPGPKASRSRTGVLVSIAAIIMVMMGVLVATQVFRPEDASTDPGTTTSASTAVNSVGEPAVPGSPPPLPPPGTYDFRLTHSALCLSEREGEDSGQVFQSDCANTVPVYSLRPWGQGAYRIASHHPEFKGGCLGIPKGKRDSGAGAYDDWCDTGAAEEFLVEPVGVPAPGFRLRLVHSDLCLTATDASTTEWTPIVQLPCDERVEGQVFELIPPVA
ncbi:BTAD domain-containing putative transcriptional regulator [Actinophytocola sediminis]